MKKIDAILLAVLLAVAAVLGTLAVTRSVRLGTQSQTNASQDVGAIVAARTRTLNANEAALRRALAKKPPKLPALPVATSSPRTSGVQTQPIVVVTRAPSAVAPSTVAPSTTASSASGEREHESEHSQHSQGGERDD
jgi:hypothetical protein